ncbi:MAG: sensor histidine kinase, partial [Aristaeellaceae bacterium]
PWGTCSAMSKKKKQKRPADERGFNRASGRTHRLLTGIMSNFRMSLTFRIALHYSGQLLRTTLPMLLVISVVFFALQAATLEDDLLRLRCEAPAVRNVFDQSAIQNSHMQAWLGTPPVDEDADGYFRLSFGLNPVCVRLIMPHTSGWAMYIVYDLTDTVIVWACLMAALMVMDLMRMIYFLRKNRRLDKRVLAPIRDITDMAATLSASNLSNRINVAGMKNELKELATVINTMLDRIERSYNSQKQFVSDASHELRTPIAVIQGYVNMLKRWGKDDKTVLDEGINAIAQETASMKELVESLLFLARHDKKTLMMEMSSFDVLDVVSELHKEAAMVTPEDTFVLSPSDHCVVEADRGMIKQVMRILCDNAVKYTPKGGTITMGVQRRPGGCTLSLSDTGPGIAPEELPKIFERFYRSDSARKAESSGHGLGLSIARIIVVAHGGKLRVRSKVGMGTTFAIDLPFKQETLHTATLSKSA